VARIPWEATIPDYDTRSYTSLLYESSTRMSRYMTSIKQLTAQGRKTNRKHCKSARDK